MYAAGVSSLELVGGIGKESEEVRRPETTAGVSMVVERDVLVSNMPAGCDEPTRREAAVVIERTRDVRCNRATMIDKGNKIGKSLIPGVRPVAGLRCPATDLNLDAIRTVGLRSSRRMLERPCGPVEREELNHRRMLLRADTSTNEEVRFGTFPDMVVVDEQVANGIY